MKRATFSLFVVIWAAPSAWAHFIWLLPEQGEKAGVRMVFSDAPAPDDNADLLDRIAHTKVFLGKTNGSVTPVEFRKDGNSFALTLEGESPTVFATCTYGIFKRGGADPS